MGRKLGARALDRTSFVGDISPSVASTISTASSNIPRIRSTKPPKLNHEFHYSTLGSEGEWVRKLLMEISIWDESSPLCTAFFYVSICSWPVLLFGALILVTVPVGSNLRQRRLHRRHSHLHKRESRTSIKSRDTSTSDSASPDKNRRASSAPPVVKPPSPIAPKPAQQAVYADAASSHKRVHSDNILNSTHVPPPSTVYFKRADDDRSDHSERSRLSGFRDPI